MSPRAIVLAWIAAGHPLETEALRVHLGYKSRVAVWNLLADMRRKGQLVKPAA